MRKVGGLSFSTFKNRHSFIYLFLEGGVALNPVEPVEPARTIAAQGFMFNFAFNRKGGSTAISG